MNKRLIRAIDLIAIIIILIIGLYFFLNKNNIGWKKINIGNGYYENETIELDLDGDNIKEKIDINKFGKYIKINDKEYTVNKYYTQKDISKSTGSIDFTNSSDYSINQYNIVDLNEDGILEIIHRTFSDIISPSTSEYTIYNFTDNKLKEIGSISIIGNIPDKIYVKGNKIKFEYWPYESPRDYTEEVVLKLDV